MPTPVPSASSGIERVGSMMGVGVPQRVPIETRRCAPRTWASVARSRAGPLSRRPEPLDREGNALARWDLLGHPGEIEHTSWERPGARDYA